MSFFHSLWRAAQLPKTCAHAGKKKGRLHLHLLSNGAECLHVQIQREPNAVARGWATRGNYPELSIVAARTLTARTKAMVDGVEAALKCKCRIKVPHTCWYKALPFTGPAINRRVEQRLRYWVASRATSMVVAASLRQDDAVSDVGCGGDVAITA
jgi:hypothetical protein